MSFYLIIIYACACEMCTLRCKVTHFLITTPPHLLNHVKRGYFVSFYVEK